MTDSAPSLLAPLRRQIAPALWVLAALLAAGCATQAPPGSNRPSPTSPLPADEAQPPRAPPPTPVASPLANEKRWLEDWFRGTPVVIALQGPGTLAVDVPLANSFEAGASALKPALAAVLERVAESMRRQGGTRITIAAPADSGGGAALAQARAQRVRDLLVSRQVAATRVSIQPGAANAAAVQLRTTLIAAPITRLDDASLPVPTNGVKPTASRPASAPAGKTR